MKIYEALYCSCTHESSYATISIHKTKKGAYLAMKAHKENDYWENFNFGRKMRKYKDSKSWAVREKELLD